MAKNLPGRRRSPIPGPLNRSDTRLSSACDEGGAARHVHIPTAARTD